MQTANHFNKTSINQNRQANFRGKIPGTANNKPHQCTHHFSASASTQGVKTQLPALNKSIGQANKRIANPGLDASSAHGAATIKSLIKQVITKIETLMNSLGAQSGGKGTCGAAGQMNTMVEKLDELGASKQPPKQEIIHLLKQISELLQKLDNTMHTNAHANMRFNKAIKH